MFTEAVPNCMKSTSISSDLYGMTLVSLHRHANIITARLILKPTHSLQVSESFQSSDSLFYFSSWVLASLHRCRAYLLHKAAFVQGEYNIKRLTNNI